MSRTDRIKCPTIRRFSGDYAFLSNFHPSPFQLNEKEWPTVEHYFQAAKTFDPELQEAIRRLPKPTQAKRMGRFVALRRDWEGIKINVMRSAVEAKFRSTHELSEALATTFPYILIEGNNWGDRFWGEDYATRMGSNFLGLILMELRGILRLELACELLGEVK